MAGETKYISRYTGAQIDEALGLLFAGESTRNAAYQAAEAERDTQFESKEAIRDEANRAALDAAEAIAELQRQARGRVSDIDSLHNLADIGTYHYIGSGWKGLVNVNFDHQQKVSQVALSSSTPSYSGNTLSWVSGPCVMVRTYTNGAWSAWSKAGADVVNDLVTGGTNKALSAEQGKVLDQKVAALGYELSDEITGYSLLDGAILVTGKFGSSPTYKHAAIPVSVGEKYILSSASNVSRYALATSNSSSLGDDIPLLSDTSVVTMENVGQQYNVTIPSGCTHLLFSAGGNYEMVVYRAGRIGRVENELAAAKTFATNLNGKVNEYVSIPVDIANLALVDFGFIVSTGLWTGVGERRGSFIDVTPGDKISIKAGVYTCRYSFLTLKPSRVSGGGTPPYVDGTTYNSIAAGEYAYIVIPQGCYCLHINRMYGENEDHTPASLYFAGKRVSVVEEKIGTFASTFTSSMLGHETLLAGRYINNTTWTDRYNVFSALFKVKPKDILTLKANDGYDTSYKFVDENLSVVNGGSVVSAGVEKSNIVVPDNAVYLYVYYQQANSTYGYRGRPAVLTSVMGEVAISSVKTDNVLTLVPKTDLPLYVARIDSTNLIWNDTTYISMIMPVVGGKTYELGQPNGVPSNSTFYLRYAWLKNRNIIVGETPAFADNHAQVYELPVGYNVIEKAPSDAKYLYIYAGAAPNYNYLSKYIKCIDGSIETAMAILRDKDAEDEGDALDSIVALNDPTNLVNLLQQMNRRYAGTGNAQAVFLHFSDIHGNSEALARIKEYYTKYSQYIGDIINTGDTCDSNPTDINMSIFYTGVATKILTVIGNHDASGLNGHPDVTPYPLEDIYAEYIAPFVANWNVTQPDDAATKYKCYYYKDYADSKLRLIVLDEYHYDADQDSWLAATLAETLDSTNSAYGYHVLMATHSANGALINRCTNFTDFANGNGYQYGVNIGSATLNAVEQVDTFIRNGGTLVAWLYGHAHYDNVGYHVISKTVDDTDVAIHQLRICVSTARYDKAGNYGVARVHGTKSQDCFNIVSVDTNRGYIRVFRVGADYDMLLKHRGGFCIDYINHEVVSNW